MVMKEHVTQSLVAVFNWSKIKSETIDYYLVLFSIFIGFVAIRQEYRHPDHLTDLT